MLDTDNGRVYRLRAKNAPVIPRIDFTKVIDSELVEMLRAGNRWIRQTALRVIGDRKLNAEYQRRLSAMITENDENGQTKLEALWALYQSGGLSESNALQFLKSSDPYVRLWTARLLCDEKKVTTSVVWALTELAHDETNVEVRQQLACSARRLPAKDSFVLPIIPRIGSHTARKTRAADPHIPLLLWWAIEDKCATDRAAVIDFFRDRSIWPLRIVREHLLDRVMRRFAAAGSNDDLNACTELFALDPGTEINQPQWAAPWRDRLRIGFEKAFEGRTIPALPLPLMEALAKAGGDSTLLNLRMGKPGEVERALERLKNANMRGSGRTELIQTLGDIDAPQAIPYLLETVELAKPPEAKAALGALQRYKDASIAETLLKKYSTMNAEIKPSIPLFLASRPEWALRLLQAVDSDALNRGELSRETLDRLREHDDPQVVALTEKLYGKPRASAPAAVTNEMRAAIAAVAGKLKAGDGNPLKGQDIFKQRCGVCHTMYGAGGRVGPDLTSYKRDDLDAMLLSITSPSAEIREGFESVSIKTKDGRRMTGIVVRQDKELVVLRGADGQDSAVPRGEIETQKPSAQSLMPEGVLNGLSDAELRNLFAFLRGTQPPK